MAGVGWVARTGVGGHDRGGVARTGVGGQDGWVARTGVGWGAGHEVGRTGEARDPPGRERAVTIWRHQAEPERA